MPRISCRKPEASQTASPATSTSACFVTFAPIVLPGLLRVLATGHPLIRIRPHEDDLRALQDGLRDGRFEVALTFDLNLEKDIAFESAVTVPLYAALPPDHRLAGAPHLGLGDLKGEPLVLLGLPDSRSYFLSLFAEAGFEPRIAYETRSFEMVRGLVANGYGYGLLHTRAPHNRTLDGFVSCLCSRDRTPARDAPGHCPAEEFALDQDEPGIRRCLP